MAIKEYLTEPPILASLEVGETLYLYIIVSDQITGPRPTRSRSMWLDFHLWTVNYINDLSTSPTLSASLTSRGSMFWHSSTMGYAEIIQAVGPWPIDPIPKATIG